MVWQLSDAPAAGSRQLCGAPMAGAWRVPTVTIVPDVASPVA